MRAIVAYLFGVAVAVLVIVLCALAIANAQTPAEVRACFHDAQRLCGAKAGATPGFFEATRIKLCMLVHVEEVSPRCRAVFRTHGM